MKYVVFGCEGFAGRPTENMLQISTDQTNPQPFDSWQGVDRHRRSQLETVLWNPEGLHSLQEQLRVRNPRADVFGAPLRTRASPRAIQELLERIPR